MDLCRPTPPVPSAHPRQRCGGAVDRPQIVHLRHPPEFVGTHLSDRREDGDHGVVDPDVDRAIALFGFQGQPFDNVRIGDVAFHDQRRRSKLLGFSGCRPQPLAGTGCQPQAVAGGREGSGTGPPDPARGSRDDGHPGWHGCCFIIW